MTTKTLRPISAIAQDISNEWSKAKSGINYAAKPYLVRLRTIESINDTVMFETARSVILYFLSNASTFRGGNAKVLKLELKEHLK